MKFLCTGGAGFLGSHLVERLIEEGHVVVIDDMSEGKWENLPSSKKVGVIQKSILDDIGDYFEGVDTVFHLAAFTRPQWSIVHPQETCRNNVEGTVKVFDHCIKHGVKRVVFVSSSSAYGDTNIFPTPEDAPLNPMSPYALTKYEGELYAKLYEKLYGLKVNSIRPFNVFGTRQNPDSPYSAAVPKFIKALKKGKTPWITGDGEQRRDFIYIDDVVEIIYRASKCKETGEAFNAGSGVNISINELYDLICGLLNKEIIPDHIEKVIEPDFTLADMDKVKKILNYEPKISIEEGLERTIYET